MISRDFKAVELLGKGVFSVVIRAQDLREESEKMKTALTASKVHGSGCVAIKVIRNNDMMQRVGEKELLVLKQLTDNDPDDKKRVVRLMMSFEWRNHLCLVLEPMFLNVRKVIRKFGGQKNGLSLEAATSYTKQMMVGLQHLHKNNIIHADLKPDNLVVNQKMNLLKVCDLGSAIFFREAKDYEGTTELVSRYYRAPEIALGSPKACTAAIDVWSAGCCSFEMFVGKILFGNTPENNSLLKRHQEVRGPFPRKIIKQCSCRDIYFDGDFNFLSFEKDKVSNKDTIRVVSFTKVSKELDRHLLKSQKDVDKQHLGLLKEFLEKSLVLDPNRRIEVGQSLRLPLMRLR